MSKFRKLKKEMQISRYGYYSRINKAHTEDSSGGNIRKIRHNFDNSITASACLPCITKACNQTIKKYNHLKIQRT